MLLTRAAALRNDTAQPITGWPPGFSPTADQIAAQVQLHSWMWACVTGRTGQDGGLTEVDMAAKVRFAPCCAWAGLVGLGFGFVCRVGWYGLGLFGWGLVELSLVGLDWRGLGGLEIV